MLCFTSRKNTRVAAQWSYCFHGERENNQAPSLENSHDQSSDDFSVSFSSRSREKHKHKLVMDFMIRFRESVRVVQFAKESRSFVRSFVQSCFRWMIQWVVQTHFRPVPRSRSRIANENESFRLTSAPVPRSRSRIANENESFRLTSAPVPRSRSRIANASRVVQTHFRPPSLVLVLVRECQPSRSDSLPPSFTTFKRITKSRFTIVQWCRRLSINTTLTKLI